MVRSISNKYKFKLKKLDNLITYVTDRQDMILGIA